MWRVRPLLRPVGWRVLQLAWLAAGAAAATGSAAAAAGTAKAELDASDEFEECSSLQLTAPAAFLGGRVAAVRSDGLPAAAADLPPSELAAAALDLEASTGVLRRLGNGGGTLERPLVAAAPVALQLASPGWGHAVPSGAGGFGGRGHSGAGLPSAQRPAAPDAAAAAAAAESAAPRLGGASRFDADRVARAALRALRQTAAASEAEVAERRRAVSLMQEELRAGRSSEGRGVLASFVHRAMQSVESVLYHARNTTAKAGGDGGSAAGDGRSAAAASAGQATGEHRKPKWWNPFELICKVLQTPMARLVLVVLSFAVFLGVFWQFSKHFANQSTSDASLTSQHTQWFHEDSDDGACEAVGKSCGNCCAHLVCDCSLQTRVRFWTVLGVWLFGLGLMFRWHFLQPILEQLVMVALFVVLILFVIAMVVTETYFVVSGEIKGAYHFLEFMHLNIDRVLSALGFEDFDDDDDSDDPQVEAAGAQQKKEAKRRQQPDQPGEKPAGR